MTQSKLEAIKAAEEWWSLSYSRDHEVAIREALAFHRKYLELHDSHKFVPISPSMQVQHVGNEAIKKFCLPEDGKGSIYSAPIYRAMLSAAIDPFKEGGE